MNNKIAIIGVGHVGAHVAAALVSRHSCNQVLLVDIDEKKAVAEALDLTDCAALCDSPVAIRAASYNDIGDCDFIVMAACSRLLEEDRLLELRGTIEVLDSIIPSILSSGFSGTIISISNPCDIVAQYLNAKTGLDVIGTGTLLDTGRMRARVGAALNVSPSSVSGFCLGEHGNSQMIAWSTVTVNGVGINSFDLDKAAIERSTTQAGWNVVTGKGCTEHGIGTAAALIIEAIYNDKGTCMPCSIYNPTQGVYVSLPCIINKHGAKALPGFTLSGEEQALFNKSCHLLKSHLKTIGL